MKKNVLVLSLLLAASLLFADKIRDQKDEVTGGFYSQKIENGVVENATPENSVLVYGYVPEPQWKLLYKGNKGGYEVTVQDTYDLITLPPVQPGSTITAVKGGWWCPSEKSYFDGKKTTIVKIETWTPLDDFSEWKINVPKDKKLYFFGVHSFRMPNSNTYEGMTETMNRFKAGGGIVLGFAKTEEDYNIWVAKCELKALKKLQKQYKGTEWEPLIVERIEEVTPLTKKKKK